MSEFKKAQEATPTFTSGSMHEVQRQTSACKALNSYCSLSDKEIWQLFRQGNEAVFIYIYSTYFTNMYRFGSQFTRNRALIKDSIQDLFIELNEKRESINVVSSIKMYLFKSLKHKIIAYQKKQQKFSLQNDIARGFDFYFDFSIEHTMIHHQIDEEKKEKLNRAIQKLNPRQKEIIYYYYYEGLSFAEVKELMEFQNVKSAQNLLYRTISLLRQQIPCVYLIYLFQNHLSQ